jgi:ADP-ribose pyrophosphatase
MKDIKTWKLLETEAVLDNKWSSVQRHTVELPGGKVINDYYVHVRPDVVLVFPLTDAGNVVMVRQYKHGAGQVLLEFPGGVIDAGESSPEAAAERELREETGYTAKSMEALTAVYDNPTKDTNRIYFFLAHGAQKTHDTHFDLTEDIETVEIPLEYIPGLIKNGEIKVTGSIAICLSALMALGLFALNRAGV